MLKYLFVSLSIFLSLVSFSQNVKITGNSPSYAGDTLHIYTYSDYITKTEKLLASSPVDSLGNYTFNVEITSTTKAFINLDVFLGIIYLEKDKNYEIFIPKKVKMLEEDRLNPYFQPQQFFIGIKTEDKNELNFAIEAFEYHYGNVMDTLFYNKYGKVKYHITYKESEDAIKQINDSTPQINNAFFDDYKKYKFVLFRYLTYFKSKDKVFDKYFLGNEILYDNPAYNEAFVYILKKYLFENKTKVLKKSLKNDIAWKNINSDLKSEIENDDLREYLSILNFYSAFYNGKLQKNTSIKLLKEIYKSSNNKFHKTVSLNALHKFGGLIEGNYPPDFVLKNQDGELVSLKKYENKFVYLNFCSAESYPCKKDMASLSALYEKKIDLLKIVTIWKGNNIEEMNNFRKKYNYEWEFLFCKEDDKVLKDYQVKVFPTYYMIHPEGQLLLISAPSPSEDFEPMYFSVYQEWHRELVRRNAKNKNGKTNNSLINN